MVDLRSLSTPNFKNLEHVESASPYVSLELLDCDTDSDSEGELQDDSSDSAISKQIPVFPSKENDSSSSTDTSSGIQMFRKPKIIKRPSNRQMSRRLKECLMRESDPDSGVHNAKQRDAMFAKLKPPSFDRK